MPYRRDLGLPGSALLVVLFLGPLLVLVACRRWRLAAARREEVMRLALLAAEESARVEMEANLAFASDLFIASGGGAAADGASVARPQCAVCYSPTTTRCSRCKAVRYCSGKCQIIHWRQGHKEDCHSPRLDNSHNGRESISHVKGAQDGRSDINDSSLETASNSSLESSRMGNDEKTSGTESSSDCFTDSPSSSSSFSSSSSSSSSSTFSRHMETSDSASTSEGSPSVYNIMLGEPSTSDIPPDNPRTSDVSKEGKSKFPPYEVVIASLSEDSASQPSSNQRKVPLCKHSDLEGGHSGVNLTGSINYPREKSFDNTIESQDTTSNSCADQSLHYPRDKSFDSTVESQDTTSNSCADQSLHDDSSDSEESQMDGCVHSDAGSSTSIPPELSAQGIPFQKISTTEYPFSVGSHLESTIQFKTKDINQLGITASGRSSDKAKAFNSLSSASLHGHKSSRGGYFVSNCGPEKVDNASKYPATLLDGSSSSNNDLKASVKKVVQQIKTSTISRRPPAGLGNYMTGKYNSKMLFPYDLFVKLYNYDKVELRPCGLINCGNSCYANVVLQCLAFTRPLTAYLLGGLHTKTCSKQDWCFMCEFERLLLKAKQGKSPLTPIGIISHIQNIGSNLAHGKEEDAHEFLRYAIDTMQSVCLKGAGIGAVDLVAEQTTLMQLTFGGYLRSKIKCTRCQGKSEQQERIMDLTVEIHGDIRTLEEALARFTATEILDGDNKYQCSRCKSYERAKKKLTVLEAPNVLTIALKRFQSGKFGKLNKTVRFPEYLNLAPYMSGTHDKSPVYRLYAVVVHLDVMNAAFSGHYVCYVKNTQGKWYKIDDSVVKPVELDRVLKQGAYMLLYARCSPRAPSVLRKATVPSGHGGVSHHISQSRPSSIFSRTSTLVAHGKNQVYPYRTSNGRERPESFDFPKTDSSSDMSSLFSCSDEGSCSTESTRDSTSTDEYSDYLFGDPDHNNNWNSPMRFSEDPDGFSYFPDSNDTYIRPV